MQINSPFLFMASNSSPFKGHFDIVIGIPVHGFSSKLLRTVSGIEISLDKSTVQSALLILVNSGEEFSSRALGTSILTHQILVPSSSYWASSVKAIYDGFNQLCVSPHLLLVNHDCIPSPDCISVLLEMSRHFTLYALHAKLCYLYNPSMIWWQGSYIGHRGTEFIQTNYTPRATAEKLIRTTSAMGQFLLIHKDLVKTDFLCSQLLPHYFSDSVQTTLMRRAGATLGVVPSAIAYTDQSDSEIKKQRMTNGSLYSYIPRVLFSPWSNRNLLARAVSTFIEIDHKPKALLVAAFIVAGTILITICEFFALFFSIRF